MVQFTAYRTDNTYIGFKCEGHAGWAEAGQDIVCAAVSALTTNTINSIETFTQDPFEAEEGEDGGYLKLMLKDIPSDASRVLLDSLVLGMNSILEEYGEDFITVKSVKMNF